jgi:hypothetical protein
MKKVSLILLVVTFIINGCTKKNDQSGVFQSDKLNFYNGKAWNWVQLDADGNTMQVAIVIDDAALNSLPVGGNNNPLDASIKFDSRSSNNPFTHAFINWNPNGHDPVFIYGKPHFDFHFYMTSEADRMAIPVYSADSVKFKTAPSTTYLPANYINPGGGVPMMGAHWIDATSPELNGAPFTQTFIYGTYNGKVTFYEPMITLEFVKATTTFERPIPQPAKYQTSGYYPTKMRLSRHDGITEIILGEFVSRQAS